jgi:thiamine biosynthesis lipoprotein
MSRPALSINRQGELWQGRFTAMGSPCEVLIDSDDASLAQSLIGLVRDEALRIEAKFSRYREDNIIYQINHAQGERVCVDEETRQLLDYAGLCHQLSDGRFDITSGILRAAWRFDGGDALPSPEEVEALLPRVGWEKVVWEPPCIRLAEGMEIDLGGIGKEYAVDRCALLLREQGMNSALVNFGGDIHVAGPRRNGDGWRVGLEAPGNTGSSVASLPIRQGGVATSGDTHRYLLRDGIRYGHILDPTSGWPVPKAPRSVTVLAPTCLQAGMLSTFAMLSGAEAESFLEAEGVDYHCLR